MARPKDLTILGEAAKFARYVEGGQHLRSSGVPMSIREIALDLGVSKDRILRYLKADPATAAKLAATRTHARGGDRAVTPSPPPSVGRDPWDF